MASSEPLCRVELLPPAQYELEEIARLHLALAGPKYARKITDSIFAALEQLARFPLSGPPLRDEELKAQGYRRIVVEDYLVIYRLLGDTVTIYHIAHGKTDYPTLMKNESPQ